MVFCCPLSRQPLQWKLYVNFIPRHEYFAGLIFFGYA